MNIFELLIVQPIFNLLIALYSIVPGGDFGLAVIIFTILVRFALYPLLKRQLHQTKMMKKLQPELKKIKERSGGNRQAEGTAMMELYKKHGVSPFRSIGILLIQLPIFLALYHVIQIFTMHRDQISEYTYSFLKNIPAISDLLKHPDHFNQKLLGLVDLSKSAFSNGHVNIFIVVLAILAALTQYWMTRQTLPKTDSKKGLRQIMAEAAEGKQADQSEINAAMMGKMSGILPVFMFFIMVTIPGVIALYYAVSNIVAVAQQAYLLREDEQEMEVLAEQAKPSKKATHKARERTAKEATVAKKPSKDKDSSTRITRISAGGAVSKSKKETK